MRSDINWKKNDYEKVDFSYLGIEKNEKFKYVSNQNLSMIGM